VELLLLLLEFADADAASVELVDDGIGGVVGVLVVVCVSTTPRATTFTISIIIWLMTVILTTVVPMGDEAWSRFRSRSALTQQGAEFPARKM
jgi:hypothetical protein